MPDTTEPTAPATNDDEARDLCFHDQREQNFNLAIHRALQDAVSAIDTEGVLESLSSTLEVVNYIRGRLIAEQAFRQGDKRNEAETIEERIDEQRGRLFEAQAIVDCLQRSIHIEDDAPTHLALGVASKALDAIVNELELIAMDARRAQS